MSQILRFLSFSTHTYKRYGHVMKTSIVAIFIIFCLSNVTYAQSEKLTIDCRKDFRKEDVAVLSHAPLGIKRIKKHHLRVNWVGGSRDFIDKPPYDEPFQGISYSYCGYNSTVGMHLIHKSMYSLFTGVLVDNTTGKIMPAGEYVSFSNDEKKYFAIAQEDGFDGEYWYVYARNGSLIWKGLSGISEKHPKYKYDYFVAEFHNPRWNSVGDLEANCMCSTNKKTANQRETIVTLKRVERKWVWLPMISCPRIDH